MPLREVDRLCARLKEIIRDYQSVLDEYPDLVWEPSSSLPVDFQALREGRRQPGTNADQRRWHGARLMKELAIEAQGLGREAYKLLQREGANIRDERLNEAERRIFPNPSPQQMLDYVRLCAAHIQAVNLMF